MLAPTPWPASGEGVVPSASYSGQVTIVLVMPVELLELGAPVDVEKPCRAIFETGHASCPESGSRVPDRLFDNGMLNMSYVICPVASPEPPASSNRVMLKPPRPGSLGDNASTPPPASFSPLSGKSSSN